MAVQRALALSTTLLHALATALAPVLVTCVCGVFDKPCCLVAVCCVSKLSNK